ncbi:MAG: HD-GYP domain-containing protein (c-di-GMP phosphodiesterase class II) [Gammaproteobacteria bacterium]|jgi:HD-GYP domain-containing protein (c-di-GMP phosphodiesterase class II)
MLNNEDTQKIDCDHIEIGMKVVELDCPWIESPFTVKGFKITSENEIRQLQQHCKSVFIAVPNPIKTEKPYLEENEYVYKNKQSFDQALPKAKSTHRMAQTVVKGFLKNLRLGHEIDTGVAKKVVKQCVDSVIANENAMIWLSLLKNVDEYTAQHSLNVGLLSIVLGRAEGLSPTDLETVGLCGMMHDMGKSEIPLDILNKEGAFSGDEFAIMKLHTTKGYHILNKKSDMEPIVAEVAYSHHERLNGQGYPRRLPAEQISYFTRIVSIADTYDAITSARVYSPAKTSLEALTILVGASGSHFDPDLVKRFVACIGVYPAGAIAELSTKEIGIILPTDNKHQNSPNVLIVRDKNKAKCRERVLNLSQKPEDGNQKLIRINHLLSDGIFDIELANYHGQITELSDQ